MKKLLILLLLPLLIYNTHANDVIEDLKKNKITDTLLEQIPDKPQIYLGMTKKNKKESLTYHLEEAISGGRESIDANDSIMVIGCRVQSCPEKGFVWVDKKTSKTIFGIGAFFLDDKFIGDGVIYLFSKDFKDKKDFPKNFIESLPNFTLKFHGTAEKTMAGKIMLLNADNKFSALN